jgi:heme/copper-type cytochrome/quinol oxidase subunit 1
MTLSPFIGRGGPLMANYIPVLDDPVFLWGLVIFGAGALLLVARSLVAAPAWRWPREGAAALQAGLTLALLPAAIALAAFAWSWLSMPDSLAGKAYYEILFWGGGHALQFIWTAFMLVAWLWLASACAGGVPMSPRIALLCFALATLCALLIPVAYLLWPAHAVEHRNLLTFAMGLGGGLPILPVALAVLLAVPPGLALADTARPLRAALYSSIALFCFGGIIGFMIAGNNVKIPAHYHGCIVGVTLALMGLVYHLLPRLGYAPPARKWATFSSYCYAAGQAMHIGGLMWSGGYGVQRKVAGAEQALRSTSEIVAMGIMGLGGLVAIIGGLVFALVVLVAMRRRPGTAAGERNA